MDNVIRTNVAVEIDRDPEQVWAVISDYEQDLRWRKGILEMTPEPAGPPQVGTRTHEVLRLAGRTYTTKAVVTEVGPGMTYRFEGEGESGPVRGRRSVTPGSAAGTAVFAYQVEVEPHGIPAVIRSLTGWMLRRSMRRDARRLRLLVERV